jgi:hypothetical protein
MRINRPKGKPQISPLRYAPVEMTNFFVQEELSSRPERSGVERSAVSNDFPVRREGR